MNKKSAGLLVYRFRNKIPEFLLVHPGGPYFSKKDLGAWSVPKGEFDDEDPLSAAKREFSEEIGLPLTGTFIELCPIVQKGGKTVFAWAVECDLDSTPFRSNTFQIEWPPKSGKFREYPEIDKAEWFPAEIAKQKINLSQVVFIEEVMGKVM